MTDTAPNSGRTFTAAEVCDIIQSMEPRLTDELREAVAEYLSIMGAEATRQEIDALILLILRYPNRGVWQIRRQGKTRAHND